MKIAVILCLTLATLFGTTSCNETDLKGGEVLLPKQVIITSVSATNSTTIRIALSNAQNIDLSNLQDSDFKVDINGTLDGIPKDGVSSTNASIDIDLSSIDKTLSNTDSAILQYSATNAAIEINGEIFALPTTGVVVDLSSIPTL